jgi:hypothetical protein
LRETYADGGVSLYQLALGLTRREVLSPTGVAHWTANTVRLILLNPCYTGSACANRIRTRPATRRKSPLQPIGPGQSWSFTPAEEWIGIPIPAIISQEVFDRVQVRLATNQQTARRSTRHDYLLRSLVQCGTCHLQCHGHFRAPDYFYYLCRGKQDALSSCHDQRCPARYIPAAKLETLVWEDLCEVIEHPELITLALERAQSGAWLPDEIQHRQASIQQALRSLDRQRDRLLAAYLAEAIELSEFERRQRELVQQRDDLQIQARQLAHVSEQLDQARAAIPTIQALCERLQAGLAQATFAQRRQLIELLIDCVIVTDEQVEIRYVIPTTEASTHVRFCHLRKDYFNRAAQPILAHQIPLRRQAADQQQRLTAGPAPVGQHAEGAPALLLEDLAAARAARAGLGQQVAQSKLDTIGAAQSGLALHAHQLVPALRSHQVSKGWAAKGALGQQRDLQAFGQDVGHLAEQSVAVGPLRLVVGLLGLPEQPGQRHGAPARAQRGQHHAHDVAMATLVEHDPNPLATFQVAQDPAEDSPVHRHRPDQSVVQGAAQPSLVAGRLGGAQSDVGLGRSDPAQHDCASQQHPDDQEDQAPSMGVRQLHSTLDQQGLDRCLKIGYAQHGYGFWREGCWYTYHSRNHTQCHRQIRHIGSAYLFCPPLNAVGEGVGGWGESTSTAERPSP